MTGVRIAYTPCSDTTSESETSALAAVYEFIISCHAKKRSRLPDKSGPDDTERSENACAKDEYTG